MKEVQKLNGEWVTLEANTGGYYYGTELVANVYGELLSKNDKKVVIVSI